MLWLLLPLHALGAAVCQDGTSYKTLGEAVANPACSEIRLDGGFLEEVQISRPVSIVGEGSAETFLVCKGTPCLAITEGAQVSISGITISGQETAISARHSTLSLDDVHLVPFADLHGGWLRLRDTDATLNQVDIVMSGRRPTPVEAVSGIGHDLNMTGVRFLGVPPRSQTLAGVYSLNYGVQCEQCSFSTRRPASWIPWEDVELLFGEFEVTTHTGVTGTARWPQLNCPTAGESDLASCADACGE